MAKRVTSTDVAREAGLSRATVSYVLNGDPRQQIPEPTKQRVRDAAARLGYRPYGPARLLRGAPSTLVLMLTPGLRQASDFVAAGIITRLGEQLRRAGLHLVWQLGLDGHDDPAADLAPCVVLSSASPSDHDFVELTDVFTVPVIPAFPGLEAFIGGATRSQVAYLVQRGKRELAFAAPADPALKPTAEVRWQAMQEACEAYGLPQPVRVVVAEQRVDVAMALDELLDHHPGLEAICAFNDVTAFAVLAAAADRGIALPDRLSVIGVDDHPLGAWAVPALTTVSADLDEFIDAMTANVVAVAAGGPPQENVALPFLSRVVERASA